ncbi:ATP-binding protein [Bradyrhizobium lupini]|uniref:PAS domain-containing sensor histidine kinase n=1 Tax=Rhizobium lupini TaxID=136996 RepID=UPI00366B9D64
MLWHRLVRHAPPPVVKEVPKEIRRRGELFEEAQRIAHVGYWEGDLATDRITFSDEASRIFDLAPREGTITIEEVTERLHPEDRAIWRSAIAQTLRGGPRFILNCRLVRLDGEVRFVSSQADLTRDASGRPLSLFGVVQDVTDLKQAEHLTQLVFERCPDAICIIGRDYRYRRVNPVFEHMTGKSAKDVIGMHVADVLGNTVFEQTVKPKQDRCFAGEEVRYADWFTYPDTPRYIAISHSPLYSKSDRVEAILSIFHDLTDYALASEALRSVQAKLAHANRVATMGQLTASIAHEVNQPIAAVVMNAQAALRWLDADHPNLQRVRQSLDLIADDGARAGEVVSRIRGLLKNAPPRKDSIDLNRTVLDVITLTRSEVLEHGLLLQKDLAKDLPLVEGDRIQLQQVILNLIMNAVDAMSSLANGVKELTISTSSDASDRALVSVRDTGPGVDPNIENRLFEAFYTTKPDGMGMGLVICRSIIEAHGGRLWVTANEPRGAVFQFSLPTKPDDHSKGGPRQKVAA